MEDVPRQAYTMGTQTIMFARSILIMASGGDKAKAVYDMLQRLASVPSLLPAASH